MELRLSDRARFLQFECRPHREDNADGRAAAQFAARFHATSVQLRDVFYNGEAETGPAQLTAARFVGAIKALENSRQITRRNAHALIGNGNAHGFIDALRLQADRAFRAASISPHYRADCR